MQTFEKVAHTFHGYRRSGYLSGGADGAPGQWRERNGDRMRYAGIVYDARTAAYRCAGGDRSQRESPGGDRQAGSCPGSACVEPGSSRAGDGEDARDTVDHLAGDVGRIDAEEMRDLGRRSTWQRQHDSYARADAGGRSEERRVGKEWRWQRRRVRW